MDGIAYRTLPLPHSNHILFPSVSDLRQHLDEAAEFVALTLMIYICYMPNFNTPFGLITKGLIFKWVLEVIFL